MGPSRAAPALRVAVAAATHDLLHLVRLAPARTAVALLCAAATTGAALLLPAATAAVLDHLRGDPRADLPVTALATVTALLLLRLLLEVCGALARAAASIAVAGSLRVQLLRQVLALGVPGTRRHAAGDLVTRVTNNCGAAAGAVPALVDAAVSLLASIGGVVALFHLDLWLAVAFLVTVVPIALHLPFAMNQAVDTFERYQHHLSTIAARLADALRGALTIRASGTAPREADRVLAPLPALARAGLGTWETQRALVWRLDLATGAVQVVMLVVAGNALLVGRISPGEFVASTLYLSLALGFLGQADHLLNVADARANASRVLTVLGEMPQAGRRGAVAPPDGPGALGFRGVSVRLTGHVLLDRVELDIPAGAAVALVGRSGAGKSTLALLAGRLLDPDEGHVVIDGVPVADLDAAALRRTVAYAFEHPVLLGRTIDDALRLGRPAASDTEVEEAIRIAGAREFLELLPDGLQTPLHERTLSGGELQRLGLARAIVQGGRVLVLDDATSSLDTITEAQVRNAMTAGLAERTRLIVAHRATTAAAADLVAWLDGGRLRALATHRQLWDAEPGYRAVFAAEWNPT